MTTKVYFKPLFEVPIHYCLYSCWKVFLVIQRSLMTFHHFHSWSVSYYIGYKCTARPTISVFSFLQLLYYCMFIWDFRLAVFLISVDWLPHFVISKPEVEMFLVRHVNGVVRCNAWLKTHSYRCELLTVQYRKHYLIEQQRYLCNIYKVFIQVL